MKRAAAALRSMLVRFATNTGLEGAFLIAGTALLANASQAISPWGPWFVVGAMCLATGIALALPTRTR